MKTSLGPRTLAYPTPVFVVGTYDAGRTPNAMAVAWGGICCSKPPCVSIAVRAATYTYGNLKERKAFTVNIPSEKYYREADYAGIVSGRDHDKFKDTGLSAEKSKVALAPAEALTKPGWTETESFQGGTKWVFWIVLGVMVVVLLVVITRLLPKPAP